MTTEFRICTFYRKTLFEESIKDLLESITLTAIMIDPTGYTKDAHDATCARACG